MSGRTFNMNQLTHLQALMLAIKILKDSSESARMPSGMAIDPQDARLHADAAEVLAASSFNKCELYEINDALHEVTTRMCEKGQTAVEIREQSLSHLWSASKKVTAILLGDVNTPGIKNAEPAVLNAVKHPKRLQE